MLIGNALGQIDEKELRVPSVQIQVTVLGGRVTERVETVTQACFSNAFRVRSHRNPG